MAAPILCVGGAVLDRAYLCTHEPALGTSNPVTSRASFGGVARNVAESLARLGARVRFVSAVGDDEPGRALAAGLVNAGVDMRGLAVLADQRTAEYTAAFWQGELFAGFADMGIFDTLTPEATAERLPKVLGDWLVFADCNLPAATLALLAERAHTDGFRLALDAVSLAKSERLPDDLSSVAVLFLNADQAHHLGSANALISRGARAIVLTRGRDGVALLEGGAGRHLPAPKVEVISVSGAGDALIAGTLFGLSEGVPLADALRMGLAVSALTLQNMATVPADLTRAKLETELAKLPPLSGPNHGR